MSDKISGGGDGGCGDDDDEGVSIKVFNDHDSISLLSVFNVELLVNRLCDVLFNFKF